MKSFFDEENRMEKISKIGDPLEILNSIINWEMFRVILKKHIVRKESNKGGRPPFDIVMMFKILVLERLYILSSILTPNDSGGMEYFKTERQKRGELGRKTSG